MKLKFAKWDKERASYVADTPTAIYRVERGPTGIWTVAVDGSPIGWVGGAKEDAFEIAQDFADELAAKAARANLRIVK